MADDEGITFTTRHRPIISPIIIETDDGATTLRWRGTDETRTLPEGATDEDAFAAVRAWEDEKALAHIREAWAAGNVYPLHVRIPMDRAGHPGDDGPTEGG